ncbi:MAG: hypothetical protein ACPMAQ_16615, partial [Phycisphaerae bacterium]
MGQFAAAQAERIQHFRRPGGALRRHAKYDLEAIAVVHEGLDERPDVHRTGGAVFRRRPRDRPGVAGEKRRDRSVEARRRLLQGHLVAHSNGLRRRIRLRNRDPEQPDA